MRAYFTFTNFPQLSFYFLVEKFTLEFQICSFTLFKQHRILHNASYTTQEFESPEISGSIAIIT